jgi:hypothetical protein
MVHIRVGYRLLLLGFVLIGGEALGGDPSNPSNRPETGAAVGPASRVWRPAPLQTGGGVLRMALYYGPWRCSQRLMDSCETKCRAQAMSLMGCIWLADMKYDWVGEVE